MVGWCQRHKLQHPQHVKVSSWGLVAEDLCSGKILLEIHDCPVLIRRLFSATLFFSWLSSGKVIQIPGGTVISVNYKNHHNHHHRYHHYHHHRPNGLKKSDNKLFCLIRK